MCLCNPCVRELFFWYLSLFFFFFPILVIVFCIWIHFLSQSNEFSNWYTGSFIFEFTNYFLICFIKVHGVCRVITVIKLISVSPKVICLQLQSRKLVNLYQRIGVWLCFCISFWCNYNGSYTSVSWIDLKYTCQHRLVYQEVSVSFILWSAKKLSLKILMFT